jgi:lipoprotein NlpD
MIQAGAWLATCSVLILSACSTSEKVAPVREAATPVPAEPAAVVVPVTHVVGAVKAESPVQSAPVRAATVQADAQVPARASAKAATEAPDFYQVQPGDNLFRIALEHGLDHHQLALWNGLSDPSRIKAGDRLRLKPANEMAEPAGEAPLVWAWPARGEIITRFSSAAGSRGLGIAGQPGDPVFAAANGRVVYVGAGLRGYGKLIIIKHSKELLTAYGHNERILVTEGQSVQSGQEIAVMGDSDADRIKLHFEIREFGKPVDPLTYLPG